MAFSNRDIRNVAIVGHGGTGKTTLFEQLLAIGGEIAQPAAVATGKSVSDFTPEEVEHGLSVHTALGHLVWNDTKINLLDTPGAAAFIGEVVPAFRATESALIVVGAKAGVQIETIKLWRRLNRRNMPRIVFVNKLDEDRADYDHVLDDLEHKFDKPVVPITVPVGQGSDFEGIVDLIANREMRPTGPTTPEELADIPAVYAETAAKYRERLVEAAAEGDDELTMKYLETEELTEAVTLLDRELAWRRQAAEQLLPQLATFDDAIRDTIGLRGQDRLPREQALYVASCSSSHRDLSLGF